MSAVETVGTEEPLGHIEKQENDQSFGEKKEESGIQSAGSDFSETQSKTETFDSEFSQSLLWDPPATPKVSTSKWEADEGEVSHPDFLKEEPIQSSNIDEVKERRFGEISTIEHDAKAPKLENGRIL